MNTKQIVEKTEALIDALRATCSTYGLSGDSSEYKIIVQVFLYKLLDQRDRSLICSPKMRNKERGLHPCRPRSRYLRQRGRRGFDFVGKRIISEDFGE